MKIGKHVKTLALIIILICVVAVYYIADYWNLIPKRHYSAEDFGINTKISTVDYNNNGIDDYTDIMLGARKDAENKPRYDGTYQEGGYPPDNLGVCTDVVWRAFKNAGYDLKAMVDEDIRNNIDLYPRIKGRPDPNIDFRRVPNLKVFFNRHAISLTLDTSAIEQWQPGDIVIYEERHVAIISDKRNKNGIPYIIHNSGQPVREEDALTRSKQRISGHYRFDASRINQVDLVPFTE